MSLKPNAQSCRLREQIVDDLPSGLTLKFERWEGGSRLVIGGRPLAGNPREIVFDADGNVRRISAAAANGRPSWLTPVE